MRIAINTSAVLYGFVDVGDGRLVLKPNETVELPPGPVEKHSAHITIREK